MRSSACMIVGLFLAVLPVGTAIAGDEPAVDELTELSLETFAEIYRQPHVVTLELRARSAAGGAIVPFARRPETVTDVAAGGKCLAVLIIDQTSGAREVAVTLERFGQAGCTLHHLSGDAADWIAAGLAVPSAPRGTVRPGEVPFVIPRGLCEPGEPVQIFD